MKAKNLTRAAIALILAVGVAGLAAPTQPGAAQPAASQPSTDKLVIVSWGGSYQEAQRKAFFEPFQTSSGIQVVEDTGPQIDRSRAEVQSGRPSYDLTVTNQPFYM